MKRSKLLLLLSMILITAMILAACGGDDGDAGTDSGSGSDTPDEAVATEVMDAGTDEAGEDAEEPATDEGETASGDQVTVVVASGSVGMEMELSVKAAEMFEASHPNINVELLNSPDLADDRLGLYLQLFEAQSTEVDVLQVDVIWPGDLAEHLIDLNPYVEKYGADFGIQLDDYFPAIVENNTVDGELVAIPWFTDAGLLYFRTDLLEKYGYAGPPATWDELTEMAQTIQDGERGEGNQDFWGFVWQGNAYEGLTCDALEWVASYGGGTVVSPDGVITINNENAAAALDRAASWVGSISPDGVTGMAEEDARAIWQSGNAAFMRNWPYAYSLGQGDDSQVVDLFDVSPLPAGEGGSPAATLGGWQLSVSEYSEHPDEAAQVALYFAGPEIQKLRAIEGSLNPTIQSLYQDEDILEAAPFFGSLYDVFTSAVARPSTVTAPQYAETSRIFFTNAHAVLTGDSDGQTAVENMEADLQDLHSDFTTGAP